MNFICVFKKLKHNNYFHVSHEIISKQTNSEIKIDMFLGLEIIGLIIDNYALGIRKPDWYSDACKSFLKRSFYYGDPNKKCYSSSGQVYEGVYAIEQKHAYFTNQEYDKANYLGAFNNCDYMTWNLSEFASGDNEVFFASKEISGSISSPTFVSHGSIGQGNTFDKQKCIISAGANISFQSGEKIHLYKGFHAKPESYFHASICPQIKVLSTPYVYSDTMCYEVSNATTGYLSIYLLENGDTIPQGGHNGVVNGNDICFYLDNIDYRPPSEYACVATFSNSCQSITRTDYYIATDSELKLVDALSNTAKQIIDAPLNYKQSKRFINGNSYSKLNSPAKLIGSLLVFPNPANNLVHIKVNNNEIINQIMVYDGFGRLISLHSSINNSFHTIVISDFASGLYVIKVLTNKSVYSDKLFKT